MIAGPNQDVLTDLLKNPETSVAACALIS